MRAGRRDDPGGEAARRDAELDRLAAAAATGDRGSVSRLLELVRQPVLGYCRARMGSRAVGLQTAEDVAQDVLLALCGALPRYRSGEKPVMAFVFGIASNKVVDAFRVAGRDRSDPTDGMPDEADGGPGPELRAVLGSQVDELRTLLGEIPENYREVLVLRVALHYSAEETAQIMGSSAGAVRVMQHRAMAKLRKLIADRPVG
ncbi:RNA polymerase sigma factor ShbA [Pseudonocardia sp. S2-4]|uniref:RNA polymerase sigma factor ShbA n=1 Tax=Pseudonocardia humida TaxID=2800819 RepID=A0ABT1AB41_9PSEU|nr:RNA polymerase sigma factor ShbA [Pseudonocardia humida]